MVSLKKLESDVEKYILDQTTSIGDLRKTIVYLEIYLPKVADIDQRLEKVKEQYEARRQFLVALNLDMDERERCFWDQLVEKYDRRYLI